MSGELVALQSDDDILLLKLYYDADRIGGANGADGIPDKYQKKVTFRVENGKWSDGTAAEITVYVTLTTEGKWDVAGTAALAVPNGMKPAEGYEGGKWDVTIPETVSGTETVVYTYTFTKVVPEPVTPPTGDETAVGAYMLLAVLSLSTMAVMIVRKKTEY